MGKTDPGRFFEDYRVGEEIVHATPRTVTEGDRALYTALYPSRFALASSDEFARASDDKLYAVVVTGADPEDVVYVTQPDARGR